MFSGFGLKPPASGFQSSFTVASRLLHLLSKTMGCLSGCLMSSASIQKLFCGIYSAFKCSFDEYVGGKVVSPSYSSAMLGPSPFPNFEPGCCSVSSSNCCFLTCIQVSQETGKEVWYSHPFKVTIKYWLYFMCLITHLCILFILYRILCTF